ncbi:MAG: metallophosphoesterase [Anaerolineae bacterium]|nr:metallophosphoesterase [Anaerolineae bacterium]
MRIAVFGDIHGNLFGLEATLADLRTQSPDAMLVTGDLVYRRHARHRRSRLQAAVGRRGDRPAAHAAPPGGDR